MDRANNWQIATNSHDRIHWSHTTHIRKEHKHHGGLESRFCKLIYILIHFQMGPCVALPGSILCSVFHKAVILSLWLVYLVPWRLLHIWTLSVTVCWPNPLSVFRPTMRTLLKSANNNTCSSESQDISVKLIGFLVQYSCLIQHICGYFKITHSNILPPQGDVLLRVQSLPRVLWHYFAASGGCDQSFCVVKWGVGMLI